MTDNNYTGLSRDSQDFKLDLDLDLLQTLRRTGTYCDLHLQSTLRDNKGIIRCHKILLFTASPFFRKVLEKEDISSFSFDSIDHDTLEALIKYIYSGGRIALRSETVCSVMDGAKMLGLKLLEEECMGFLRRLISVGTVVEILQYSRQGSYEELLNDCVRFILENLEEVKSHEFYSLGPGSIKLLVQHQTQLGFPTPEAVLETVSEWLRVDEEERRVFAYELIKDIPLWEIKIEALQRILRDDEMMRSIPEVFALYVKALEDSLTSFKGKTGSEITLTMSKRPSSGLNRRKAAIVNELEQNPLEEDVAGPSKRSCLEMCPRNGVIMSEAGDGKNAIICFVARNGSKPVDNLLWTFDLESKEENKLGTFPYNAKSGFWLGFHSARIFSFVSKARQVRFFHVKKRDWDDTSFLLEDKVENFSCVLLGNFMYQIGGALQSKIKTTSSVTQRRNLMQDHSGQWEKVGKMNHHRGKAGVCVAGGKIYVMGGYQLRSSSFVANLLSVECYDPALNKWSIRRNMRKWRGSFAVATVGPNIYVLGGDSEILYWSHKKNQGTMLDTVDVYNTEQDQWYSGVPMNKKRMHFSAIAVNDFIYAVGGDNNDHPTVERYDTNQRIWEDLGPLPPAGIYTSVASHLQNY